MTYRLLETIHYMSYVVVKFVHRMDNMLNVRCTAIIFILEAKVYYFCVKIRSITNHSMKHANDINCNNNVNNVNVS